jgi:cell division protein FtsW (lipid II flippase)
LVFALRCEELGLIIALCAIMAVIALALFAVRNAAQGRSTYYVIAGCAAVSMMMVQLGLNVFGSLDILPFTGVTFPFVSKGGTSLIACWMMLAFVKASDTRRDASFVVRPQAGRRVRPDNGGEGAGE